MVAAALDILDVTKNYGAKPVLKGLSFHVEPGEFIVLVGPSGCGKSTMLRSIAGLESVTSGQIKIGSRDVTALEPKDRDIAMVFQDYALYPHKTVYENIAFGLRVRKRKEDEINRLVLEAAERLNLTPYLQRRPVALSGGQRQRVAIGRAIVRQPQIFLFDEPLSNLDAKLRGSMRVTIAKLHRDLGTTIVYVTHDQVEAMTLADRIVVLEGGKIQQVGKPLDLYYHPKNVFVATFIGTPPMNLIYGTIDSTGTQFLSEGGLTFTIPEPFAANLKSKLRPGQPVIWGIRPENMRLVEAGTPPPSQVYKAKVVVTEPLGPQTSVFCETQGHELHVSLPAPHRPKRGDELSLYFQSKHLYFFDRETQLSLLEA